MGCWRVSYLGNVAVVNEGMFYIGPSTGILGFNIFLTLATTGLALGPASPHPAASAIGGVICLIVLYYLFRTATSDPGIIPRQPDRATWIQQHPQVEQIQQQPPVAAIVPTQLEQHGLAREVMLSLQEVHGRHNGRKCVKTMELPWCYTCNIVRPLRSSHDRWSDCCIEQFDHFCPWVGCAVGARNYRFFFGYVNSLLVYCVFMIGSMIASMVTAAQVHKDRGERGGDAFSHGLQDMHYLPVVCLIIAVIVLCLVGGLACYHCGLVADNKTTHEDLRRYYSGYSTPFDKGSACENCDAMLCAPIAPPYHVRYATIHAASNPAVLPSLDGGVGVIQEVLSVPEIISSQQTPSQHHHHQRQHNAQQNNAQQSPPQALPGSVIEQRNSPV